MKSTKTYSVSNSTAETNGKIEVVRYNWLVNCDDIVFTLVIIICLFTTVKFLNF